MFTRKRCPQGQITRKGYTREYGSTVKRHGYLVRRSGKTIRIYPKTKKIRVGTRCIENRGLPGKGVVSLPGSTSIVETPLKKGELTKFGYHTRYPKSVRRDALRRAASAYGPLSLYHKLDAVAKLSIRQAPAAASVFARDRDWVRRTYPIRKSLSPRA